MGGGAISISPATAKKPSARGRVPVCGTINGFKFRSSFSPMGGKHILCINKEMQAGAKGKPGDRAHFVIERDDKPRTVTLPPSLKKALAKEPKAKAIFDKLSYSHRKEYALWVAQPKHEETVQRRLAKLIPMPIEKIALKNKPTTTPSGSFITRMHA